MKVLVCGSRHFNDYERLREVLSDITIEEIIHGGFRGTDTLAGRFAEENRISARRFPARWDEFGKRAGPLRNSQMLSEGCPDQVVAFIAPGSRGTKNMIEQAEAAGIPVTIIKIGE